MKIECISQPRKGGTYVSLPIAGSATLERKYHFRNPGIDDPTLTADRRKQLEDEAPHVCDVADEAHVAMFLAVPEAFQPFREPLTPEEEAAEIERLKAEEAERAKAAAEADAARAAAEQAEIERQIAHEESLAAAARALRDNQVTAAEAEAAKAGVPITPREPEAPSNPENAVDPMRAQQLAAIEAQAKADRERAEAVRAQGTMSLTDARAAYKTRFEKNPSPRWGLEEILEKLAAKE